jgi:hypothetical protein
MTLHGALPGPKEAKEARMIRTLCLSGLGASLLAASLLSSAGCGGPKHKRTDATEASVVDTNKVGGDEIEIAVKDLCDKLSKQYAKGWPAHIILTEEGKPQARVGDLTNKTTSRFEIEDLRNEIYNALVNQSVVYVVGQKDDVSQVQSEREYSGAMMGKEVDATKEDTNGFILTGEITDEFIEGENAQGENVRQHTIWFSLRFVDIQKNRIVVTTRTKMRKEKEL